jgi:Fe-S oxidoreductase
MMLAGHKEQANLMIERNRSLILDSGAGILVTSCPICYKVFTKEYHLDIRIMHHTQYLLELANTGRIHLDPVAGNAAYHDPCELSRDIRVFDEPRMLISKIMKLTTNEFEKDNSLCCGYSLANFSADNEVRKSVARDACMKLTTVGTDFLITSCPLCKKAFASVSEVPVKDIAELVAGSLHKYVPHQLMVHRKKEAAPSLMLH